MEADLEVADPRCSEKILKGLIYTETVMLGLATIITLSTLCVIIHRRRRFQRHHIFAFNIILADFLAAVSYDVYYCLAKFLNITFHPVSRFIFWFQSSMISPYLEIATIKASFIIIYM